MTHDPKNVSPAPENKISGEKLTVPIWIFSLGLTLLFLAGVYFDYSSGWFNPQVYAPFKNAGELEAYQPKSGAAMFLAQGKKNYDNICATCHGPNGEGKAGQAPPLAGSEWVNGSAKRLEEIPQLGIIGPLHVESQSWNSQMAAMGAGLSDSDLAALLTYIRTSWSNKGGDVAADDVKSIRAQIAGHPSINGEAGLNAIKE